MNPFLIFGPTELVLEFLLFISQSPISHEKQKITYLLLIEILIMVHYTNKKNLQATKQKDNSKH